MKQAMRITGLLVALVLVGSAQAQSKFGATPEDSVTCVNNLSLYQEAMKNSNVEEGYRDAYGPWKEVLRVCPTSMKGIYQNGTKILSHFIEKEKDATRKQRLIDSLYLVYDMRVTHFGEEDFVMGRKAIDMMQLSPDRAKEVYETLHKSVENAGVKSEAGTLNADYQALNNLYARGEATKDQMLAEYVFVIGFLEANMSDENKKESDREYYSKARDNVNLLFFKIAECSDIGRIVEDMLKAKPDDIEMKGRLLKVLNGKDCTDEKVYQSLAEEVHRASPSAESAYSLALFLAKQNDISGSLKYMKEAVELCPSCPDRTKYLLKAGQVASAAGSHSQARSFANQVLQAESKNGEAFILIGNAVAAQAGSCEAPDSWGAYWLAYDYYQRARSLDPSVADKAGDRMASSTARFPTQAEAFFYQLTDGQSVQVACGGLNESTTVRTRK